MEILEISGLLNNRLFLEHENRYTTLSYDVMKALKNEKKADAN